MASNGSGNTKTLEKTLTFSHLWAIGVGSVVGDGIFLLLGNGIASAGPAVIISYIGAGVLMLSIAIALSELAIALPSAGSLWVWGRETYGDYIGFMAGIGYAGGWLIAAGSAPLALAHITEYFAGGLHIPIVVWALIWLSASAALQLVGAYLSSWVQLVLVLLLMLIVFAFGLSTVFDSHFSFSRFHPFMPNGLSSVAFTLAIAVFAYVGPLALTTAGDEVKNVRDIPRALIWSCVTIMIVYTLAIIGMVGLKQYSEFNTLTSPFTAVAQVTWGENAALIINVAAWTAAFTTVFMGVLYSAPRMLFKMGQMKVLPNFLGTISGKHNVPVNATLFVWFFGSCLILISWFNVIDYSQLALLGTFLWLVSWLIVCGAAIKFRISFYSQVEKAGWRQPFFPLFPIIGIIGIVIAAWGTFSGALLSFGLGVLVFIALSIFYLTYGKRRLRDAAIPLMPR